MAFVPLHNHSDYSLLDGASQLPAMVERAKELGMPAIALTDHGVMYGAIELLKLCKGSDLKPIIGNEMYVINGSIDDPQPKKEKRYHLVVLAKNAVGYRNLVKLTSISHLRGMRGRGIFSPPKNISPTLISPPLRLIWLRIFFAGASCPVFFCCPSRYHFAVLRVAL